MSSHPSIVSYQERVELLNSVRSQCRWLARRYASRVDFRADIESELCILAWKLTAKFDPDKGKFMTYFYRYAPRVATFLATRLRAPVRVSKTLYRQYRTADPALQDGIWLEDAAPQRANAPAIDLLLEKQQELEQMHRALQLLIPELKPRERAVLELLLDGCPISYEAEERLGISRQRISVIRKDLLSRIRVAMERRGGV